MYESQILIHNICHIYVITIYDIVVVIFKVLDESNKNKQLIVNTPNIEVTKLYNTTNIIIKYNWQLNPINNEVVVELK